MIDPVAIEDVRQELLAAGWSSEIGSQYAEKSGKGLFVGHRIILRRSGSLGFSKIETVVEFPTQILATLNELAHIASTMVEGKEYELKVQSVVFSKDETPHIKTLAEDENFDFKGVMSYEIAEKMMKLGWQYSDKLSRHGSSAPSRWFGFAKYWWHDHACGAPVTFFQLASANADFEKISRDLAQLSLKAWDEFPDSIPRLDLRGKLVVDQPLTKIVFKK